MLQLPSPVFRYLWALFGGTRKSITNISVIGGWILAHIIQIPVESWIIDLVPILAFVAANFEIYYKQSQRIAQLEQHKLDQPRILVGFIQPTGLEDHIEITCNYIPEPNVKREIDAKRLELNGDDSPMKNDLIAAYRSRRDISSDDQAKRITKEIEDYLRDIYHEQLLHQHEVAVAGEFTHFLRLGIRNAGRRTADPVNVDLRLGNGVHVPTDDEWNDYSKTTGSSSRKMHPSWSAAQHAAVNSHPSIALRYEPGGKEIAFDVLQLNPNQRLLTLDPIPIRVERMPPAQDIRIFGSISARDLPSISFDLYIHVKFVHIPANSLAL